MNKWFVASAQNHPASFLVQATPGHLTEENERFSWTVAPIKHCSVRSFAIPGDHIAKRL